MLKYLYYIPVFVYNHFHVIFNTKVNVTFMIT